jgi:2-polyprenyl-3-methyl-5-hydroxy-6-metoxy-1,4-benzoquinol methylase
MPWYNKKLDADLEEVLVRKNIIGGRILGPGTGPDTLAIQLAKRGLQVTGSDISQDDISRTRKIYSSK